MAKTYELSVDGPSPCCGPSDPAKPYYPRLSVTTEGEKIPFPDEGTALIRFKKIGSSDSNRDGKKTYSCDLDVVSITLKDGEKKRKSDHDAGSEALDKLRDAKSKDGDADEDY